MLFKIQLQQLICIRHKAVCTNKKSDEYFVNTNVCKVLEQKLFSLCTQISMCVCMGAV